ncbi:MAG: YhgE/Pip domain-containing protein [Collinsella sp.]|nr:YhgE/Pip domain-containing protein [Collinsella sp.]
MGNIFKIFKNDLRNIGKSTIGMIVLVGLVVVPVLYAWFNIAGSWDPYGNTGNLKVAVANSDEGYKGDLLPLTVNLGDQVVSSLRANDALDWVFVDERDAVEGVRSGEYYAAVVIPADFSSSMMTVFSSEVEHSQIIYYENQKANAIAPRVTDKGASTIRQQIDETFTRTVGDIGIAAASNLLDFVNGDELATYASNLGSALDSCVQGLRDASASVSSFADLTDSMATSMESAGTLLGEAGTSSDAARDILSDVKSGLADIEDSFSEASDAVDGAISAGAAGYDSVSQAVDDAFTAVGQQSADAQAQLRKLAGDINGSADSIDGAIDSIRAIRDRIADSGVDLGIVARLDDAIGRLESVSLKHRQLASSLTDAADKLAQGMEDAERDRQEVADIIAEAKDGVQGLESSYETELSTDLANLRDSIDAVSQSSASIADSLDAAASDLGSAATSLAGNLSDAGTALSDAASALGDSAVSLERLEGELGDALQSGDLQRVRALIGEDPDALALALSAPVGLDRHSVFHIENYGSAMAPFYTILSLWVGGIVLAAMLKVGVDDRIRGQLGTVRLHELYLGRLSLFVVISLCQSTLVCAGDILFFQIQCDSPLRFMLAGWLAGFVFCNIIYALTVSFGDIGKALAVVLLVMQVAGSGGTFPIEMTADFFQVVYPLLPFTHAINAMHAAIAGSYGMEYRIEMAVLASYLIPALALGLVLRRPVIKANEWIIEQLEETKLM